MQSVIGQKARAIGRLLVVLIAFLRPFSVLCVLVMLQGVEKTTVRSLPTQAVRVQVGLNLVYILGVVKGPILLASSCDLRQSMARSGLTPSRKSLICHNARHAGLFAIGAHGHTSASWQCNML